MTLSWTIVRAICPHSPVGSFDADNSTIARLLESDQVHRVCCWEPPGTLRVLNRAAFVSSEDWPAQLQRLSVRVLASDSPLQAAGTLFQSESVQAIAVIRDEQCFGIVTRDSLMAALLAENQSLQAKVQDCLTIQTAPPAPGINEAERRLWVQRELGQLAQTFNDVLWIGSTDRTQLFYLSPRFEQVWGRPASEFYAAPLRLLETIHPDDLAAVQAEFAAQAQDVTTAAMLHEYRIVLPTGSIRWIRTRYAAVRDVDGHVLRIAGISFDITRRKLEELEAEQERTRLREQVLHDIAQRKQTEEELRDNERRLRDIFDGLPFFVGLSEPDGSVKFVNRRLMDVLKVHPLSLMGGHLAETTWFNHSPAMQEHLRTAVIRANQGLATRIDLQVKVSPERFVWMDAMIAPLFDQSGRVRELVGSAVDITERREIEEQARRLHDELAHALRLSTLGEMASGIAHELNQPLTVIANFAFLVREQLRQEPQESGRVINSLRTIEDQAQRAAGIIRGLKNLVRKSPSQHTSWDLPDLIQPVVQLLQPELRQAQIKLLYDFEEGLPPVLLDVVQIQQVLLNLLRNSLEALRTVAHARQIRLACRRVNKHWIEVAVTDNGPGIPAWVSSNLFVPFTTSKTEGLGLGLVICSRIIEAHQGKLWIDPQTESGTTFRFTLPVAGLENSNNGQ